MVLSARRFAMHRGYRTEAPENSIPAFTKAGEADAWGIETDIRQTSDTDNSYFICLHSNDLAETTSGTGYVNQTPYSTIETLRLTQGAHIEEYTDLAIPTFEQYLKICKKFGCVAVIDVKGVRSYEDFVTVVVKNGMEGSCVFLVYDTTQITSIRQYTLAPIALVAGTLTDDQLVDTAKNYYNVWVDFNVTSVVDNSLVISAHSNKLPVLIWTADNHSTINTLFEYGVDIITSNSVATPE